MSVDYRPAPGTIPTQPGVYRFRDRDRRVIYVGKAKNLRNRLNSYFADENRLHERTRRMVNTARSVEWTVVGTEVEALQLEWTWIKEYDPRFNVMFKDDKSYPWLAVTVGEEFPRAQVMRGARRKGVRYFGPFGSAWAIRQTLDLLTRVFPIRTCSDTEFKRCNRMGRPNLLADIGKCSAPCVGRVSAEDYRELVDGFCSFMAGDTAPVRRRLIAEMQAASETLDFEKAARLRDDLAALDKVLEQQVVVLAEDVDCDVMAVADDELQAAVQV
ncbi:excinuclease ABC subunit UvrC, partial [Glycomyces tenuis]